MSSNHAAMGSFLPPFVALGAMGERGSKARCKVFSERGACRSNGCRGECNVGAGSEGCKVCRNLCKGFKWLQEEQVGANGEQCGHMGCTANCMLQRTAVAQ